MKGMNSEAETIGKFVKLRLTEEVVELENYDSNSRKVTIKYRGQNLTLRLDEISTLTPDEISRHERLAESASANVNVK